MTLQRRHLLAVALAPVLPVAATPEALAAAIRAFVGNAPLRDGRVHLDVSPLVENGNTVPLEVSIESPMNSSDRVLSLAVFNERNPLPDVAVFHLSPRSGRAHVATRIRLATSQQLVAIAKLADGSCWQQRVDVVVTLAACVES